MTQEVQLPVTRPTGVDEDWREKIAAAIQARKAAQKAREGKPAVFPTNWSLQPNAL
ncbi:MAG: hypothetical protein M0010_18845 [Actinomycetota bacterium]|jgi:hypothetical protein|nr:hypothetical protein [Actinomycetota bacterium]MDA8317205.1 hypothetical protein [Actinomycetota bacterium]